MGKRIFITGTATGFGHDAAKELAARGHTVYATMVGAGGKNAERALALSNWAAESGRSLRVLECDVTSQSSVTQSVGTALDDGDLDVVINNAGVGNWGIDEGFGVEQAQRLFDVNVFGVMRVNRAVLPHFRSRSEGLLCYISSMLGRVIVPFHGLYISSKHALEAYAESVAYETRPLGIGSVIVQPGAFGTQFLQHAMAPETDLSAGYGETAAALAALTRRNEEETAQGGLADPGRVRDAIVEEVERSGGADRPLRRLVGDEAEFVAPLNELHEQTQESLLKSFGPP